MKNLLKVVCLILIFTSGINLTNCKNSESDRVKKIVAKRLDSKLNLIDSLKSYSLNDGWVSRVKPKKINIVTFIDGTCSSCITILTRWQEYISRNNSKKVNYFFYVKIYNVDHLRVTLESIDFTYPVIVDYRNTFFTVNKLENIKIFQTFLMDENMKVVLVGNPLYKKSLRNLYSTTISKY